jgi:hypothetical protein
MVDYWPQEEGAVFDANSYILPCYPDDTILELSSVTVGTTVAGRISVTVSAAVGDGIGIALKAATSAGIPERIPVLFYGAVKTTYTNPAAGATTMGVFVMNSITTTMIAHPGALWASLVASGAGSSRIMGMALQACADADTALILVGKCV